MNLNLKPQNLRLTWPIVGHKRITQFLKDQIKNEAVSHAYLFLGPKSLGKYTTALLFAQTLLCLSKAESKDQSFCQACPSCHSFSKNIHPDFILIKNTETPISIETVRQVRRQIALLPSLGNRKIIIFEGASYLTLEAQNALLKTLEEPPKYATIILVAQKENLLPTILSRCVKLVFQPVSKKEIKEELIKRGIGEKDALLLSHLSLGQIGKVLEDQQFIEKWEESLKTLSTLIKSSLKEKMEYAKALNPEDLNLWVSIFRAVLLYKLNPTLLSNYPPALLGKLENLASRFSLFKIHTLLKELQEAEELKTTSINQKLLYENLLLQM